MRGSGHVLGADLSSRRTHLQALVPASTGWRDLAVEGMNLGRRTGAHRRLRRQLTAYRAAELVTCSTPSAARLLAKRGALVVRSGVEEALADRETTDGALTLTVLRRAADDDPRLLRDVLAAAAGWRIQQVTVAGPWDLPQALLNAPQGCVLLPRRVDDLALLRDEPLVLAAAAVGLAVLAPRLVLGEYVEIPGVWALERGVTPAALLDAAEGFGRATTAQRREVAVRHGWGARRRCLEEAL